MAVPTNRNKMASKHRGQAFSLATMHVCFHVSDSTNVKFGKGV